MYYSEMTLENMLLLGARLMADDEPAPRCEYRSPEYDGGTGVGRMRQCPDDATMWTDRGLRCDAHGRD